MKTATIALLLVSLALAGCTDNELTEEEQEAQQAALHKQYQRGFQDGYKVAEKEYNVKARWMDGRNTTGTVDIDPQTSEQFEFTLTNGALLEYTIVAYAGPYLDVYLINEDRQDTYKPQGGLPIMDKDCSDLYTSTVTRQCTVHPGTWTLIFDNTDSGPTKPGEVSEEFDGVVRAKITWALYDQPDNR